MPRSVAILGDYFMLPEVFEEKIEALCGDKVSITTRKDNWPNEPMEHGYAVDGMDGLKEYFGSADDVVEFIGDAEIFVTQLAPMSRSMLEKLPNLKVIAVSRGGPVNIDMRAAKDNDVLVVNTPGRNASAVAEFAVGAILAETRKIREGHEDLRNGVWRGDLYRADLAGRELNEMTVGVIGHGQIGSRLTRLLRAFGCRILVHDPYIQLSSDDISAGIELVSFDTLLTESDVVSMHARVTEETQQMMDADAFSKMKPGSLFVNTARGPLCNYDDLYAALTDGHLGSAMLETFSVEPPPEDWDLLKLPNVTLTPHIAGASYRTVTYAAEQAAEEVRRFVAGEPPKNPC